LPAALKSVRASKGVELEIIVVDHASRDESAAIARGFGATVLEAPRAASLAEVLEVGRARCRAPLIARMDADDLMNHRRLAEDVARLRAEPSLALTSSRARLFPRGKISPGMYTYVLWQNAWLTPEDHARELWIEQPLCHPTITFRASALDEVGGYRAGTFPEDYELLMRMMLAGLRMEKRPVVRHLWRDHGARETYKEEARMHRDAFAEVKAEAMVARYAVDERPVLVLGTGREAGRIARALDARGVRAVAYFDLPEGRVGRTRYGAPVVDVAELAAWRAEQPRAFAIGAVGTSGARGGVRMTLADAGFTEGEDALVIS
jgi:hypothetical protein